MSTPLEATVRMVHGSGRQIVLAITGGGSSAISHLLSVPGGSTSLLEAIVPYAPQALIEFLGAPPEHFCCEPTARAMAMAGFSKARHFSGEAANMGLLAGVACTASLISDRPKRGPHRAHCAWQTLQATTSASIELIKGARERAAEEDLVARLVISTIAEAVGARAGLDIPLMAQEKIVRRLKQAPPSWQDLLVGRKQAILIGDEEKGTSKPQVVFPGAFHPRHEGHRKMARLAAQLLGKPVAHEISIENVDKPTLDYLEMADRAGQFEPSEPLWFTRAPKFVDKARLFPGATFVVGIDTLIRIADAHYYGGSINQRKSAVQYLIAQGCRFLVFGRLVNGRFQGLKESDVPTALRRVCQEVPMEQFREDISSTEIRRAASAAALD
jgi:hypothetical protein